MAQWGKVGERAMAQESTIYWVKPGVSLEGWVRFTPQTTKVGPFRRAKLIFAGKLFPTNVSVLLFFLYNCYKKVGYACNLSTPKVK